MPHQRVTLMVFGSHTYLGRETARLGRAMDHRIVAAVDTGIPDRDEPWMHGVHWTSSSDPLIDNWTDPPVAAIIYCDTALWESKTQRFEEILLRRPTALIASALEMEPLPRFILRSTVAQPLLPSAYTTMSRRMEKLVLDSDLSSTILRCPLLYGPDRPDSVAAMMAAQTLRRAPFGLFSRYLPPTMRVETAALATLRAALEPDIAGILEPNEIEEIGDVMIAQ